MTQQQREPRIFRFVLPVPDSLMLAQSVKRLAQLGVKAELRISRRQQLDTIELTDTEHNTSVALLAFAFDGKEA